MARITKHNSIFIGKSYKFDKDVVDLEILFEQSQGGALVPTTVKYAILELDPSIKIEIEVATNGYIITKRDAKTISDGGYGFADIVRDLTKTKMYEEIPFKQNDWKGDDFIEEIIKINAKNKTQKLKGN